MHACFPWTTYIQYLLFPFWIRKKGMLSKPLVAITVHPLGDVLDLDIINSDLH